MQQDVAGGGVMSNATLTPDRHAFREAVAVVAEKAKAKLPECNGRVESAVKLVLAGDVEAQLEDGSWRVGSAVDPMQTHIVHGTSCSCDDSQYGRAPHGYCKHALAVMIAIRVQELLPQAPESPPEVHQGCTTALPEAPASVNVKVLVQGYEVQVTLRDTDENALLGRLATLLKRGDIRPLPPKPARTNNWKPRYQSHN